MRNAYLRALYDLSKENSAVIAAVADNGAIVYDKYRADFPEQFINFGIAEATMVSACAGLASCGKIPFAYTIIPFLTMRAFEQVRNDVCLQRHNVKLIGVGGGFAYSTLGSTHHAIEDLAIMRVLPNMTVVAPASPLEVYQATLAIAKYQGPVYLRIESTKEPEIYDNSYSFQLGRGVTIHEGRDLTMIAAGSIVYDVLQAAKELEKKGVQARVINLHTVKPLDQDLIGKAAEETRAIITVEEHNIIGGLGGAVAETLIELGYSGLHFERMGLKDTFCHGYGTHDQVKQMNGLSMNDMVEKALQMFQGKQSKA